MAMALLIPLFFRHSPNTRFLPGSLKKLLGGLIRIRGAEHIKNASIYSNGNNPVFEEGDVFRYVIPLDWPILKADQTDGKAVGELPSFIKLLSDTVNDTVSDTVKQRLVSLIQLLYEHSGQRSNELAVVIGVSECAKDRRLLSYPFIMEEIDKTNR